MIWFRLVDEAFQDSAFSGEGARLYGGRWNSSVGLTVPSAITPGERNLLLNPAHPDYAAALSISVPAPLILDHRLIKAVPV